MTKAIKIKDKENNKLLREEQKLQAARSDVRSGKRKHVKKKLSDDFVVDGDLENEKEKKRKVSKQAQKRKSTDENGNEMPEKKEVKKTKRTSVQNQKGNLSEAQSESSKIAGANVLQSLKLNTNMMSENTSIQKHPFLVISSTKVGSNNSSGVESPKLEQHSVHSVGTPNSESVNNSSLVSTSFTPSHSNIATSEESPLPQNLPQKNLTSTPQIASSQSSPF